MRYSGIAASATALMASVASATVTGVTGKPEGFASSATGGGDTAAVYPSTTDELVSYLGDKSARVIVLTKTFDFRGTEGTTTSSGCAPWGTGAGCQTAIDKDKWCENYQPEAPSISSITYDAAGTLGITVGSDKSIIGDGSKGIIKGKGLRIVNGAQNVILQNIQISDINPKYVWGGDAITLDGTDNVWIDHVTVSLHHPSTHNMTNAYPDFQYCKTTHSPRHLSLGKRNNLQLLHRRLGRLQRNM
jgi:pectin lyase